MGNVAPIIHQTPGKICFQVDAVEASQELLPVQPAKQALEQLLEAPLKVWSHDDGFEVVDMPGVRPLNRAVHPLIGAVHMAFSQHRPLVLTPDVIWLTIAQGFAQHVNNHAEHFRSRFVRHEGKLEILAKTEQLGGARDWDEMIDTLTSDLGTHLGAGLRRLMVCDFTTTTAASRTASQMVMMDTFKQYFDYVIYCICGIPTITLRGTPADWRTILARVEVLSEYELGWWTMRLLPICQAFVDTAEGQPLLAFWQKIYKPREIYGGELITGWLADLFPYIKQPATELAVVQNPLLAKRRHAWTHQFDPSQEKSLMQQTIDLLFREDDADVPRTEAAPDDETFLSAADGIMPSRFPIGLSQVPFTLKTSSTTQPMEFVAGFIGVTQDAHTLALLPEIGWGARLRSDILTLLSRVEAEHQVGPPFRFADSERTARFHEMPKELLQLLERFNGATLFAESSHRWRFCPAEDHMYYFVHEIRAQVTHFGTLADGRCLVYKHVSRRQNNLDDGTAQWLREWWFMVGAPDPEQLSEEERFAKYRFFDPRLIVERVIAKSLPQLLERIFAAKGQYYFDDPCFVPDEELDAIA